MIKINKNDSLIITSTIDNLKKEKLVALYLFLLAEQQDKIYYQTIDEIVEHFKKHCYKTIQKCLKELIEKGLIYKKKGLYIVNYIPMKEC